MVIQWQNINISIWLRILPKRLSQSSELTAQNHHESQIPKRSLLTETVWDVFNSFSRWSFFFTDHNLFKNKAALYSTYFKTTQKNNYALINWCFRADEKTSSRRFFIMKNCNSGKPLPSAKPVNKAILSNTVDYSTSFYSRRFFWIIFPRQRF